MELLSELKIGWLNGWLVIALLGVTEGVLFLAFPKKVVRRFFDRSGWSRQQKAFTIAGKLCAFVCLVLLALIPLKIGHPVFVIGASMTALGLVGLSKAMLDFGQTPLNAPVTRGLYRVSRHPQIVMSSLIILGGCVACGSWAATACWGVARLLEHYGIKAEEEVCLEHYGDAYRTYLRQVPRYFVLF